MKQHKYALATTAMFILIVWLSSCKKFLDQKPDQKLSVPTTLTEAANLLNYYTVINCQGPDMGMESDDDFYMADALYNTSTQAVKATYTWQKDIDENFAWENMYKVILSANVALELTQKIAPTIQNQTEWNNVKGRALFHRSYAFYQLAQTFAAPYNATTAATLPGIPLRLASDLNTPVQRGTLAQTYTQLLADLHTAAPLLAPVAALPTMPSRASVYGMLARVYHSMENYPLAFNYADSAFLLQGTLINFNTLSTTAAVPFVQFNAEITFAATLAGLARFSVNNLLVDSVLYSSYHADDLRRELFFKNLSPQPGYGFKGNYEGNTHGQLFTGISNGEIYLIKAECQARLNDHSSAMQTLNTLLITRWRSGTFVPFIASNPQQALDIIIKERRKELVGRGLRWQDLRRYNQHAATAITLKRMVNGNTFLLPPDHPNYTFKIPQIVIEQSGIAQNTRQ